MQEQLQYSSPENRAKAEKKIPNDVNNYQSI